MGVASAAPPSLKVHSSLPVFASNARKRPSSVAPTNTSPPAVAIVPPFPGRPVFCLSAGRLSVTPIVTRNAEASAARNALVGAVGIDAVAHPFPQRPAGLRIVILLARELPQLVG